MLDINAMRCYIVNVKLALLFEEMIIIKNRVAELRKQAGLTQEQLGDKVGVSRQTIISLENGKYNPSITLAHRLAVVFGGAIEDVFIFEEDE